MIDYWATGARPIDYAGISQSSVGNDGALVYRWPSGVDSVSGGLKLRIGNSQLQD